MLGYAAAAQAASPGSLIRDGPLWFLEGPAQYPALPWIQRERIKCRSKDEIFFTFAAKSGRQKANG
ncbi:MAG: hypothetical protein WAM75_19525 [Xanthobacteraceae bacterium]